MGREDLEAVGVSTERGGDVWSGYAMKTPMMGSINTPWWRWRGKINMA
jgi:hypothetical protein